ncbi:unnamed protein product [Arabis nemorensis]|uniref:Uncharacterized protein n=1 Tax=Arabis nemorensis TaxID=586526 RepID=A0A565BXZ2_9BRAS|nr:unnamed protein product [Arabis nemorensis]
METKEIDQAQIYGLQGQTSKTSFESNKEADKSDGDCVTKSSLDDSNARNGRDPKPNEGIIRHDYRTLSKGTLERSKCGSIFESITEKNATTANFAEEDQWKWRRYFDQGATITRVDLI